MWRLVFSLDNDRTPTPTSAPTTPTAAGIQHEGWASGKGGWLVRGNAIIIDIVGQRRRFRESVIGQGRVALGQGCEQQRQLGQPS